MEEELDSLNDEEIYDQIIDEIETVLDIDVDTLEIDVEDGFVSIWGSVPSVGDSEELEKLLFEKLGLENVDFDVVIDEGMQTAAEAMEEETRGRGRGRDEFDITGGEGGLGDGGFDDFSEPRHQI